MRGIRPILRIITRGEGGNKMDKAWTVVVMLFVILIFSFIVFILSIFAKMSELDYNVLKSEYLIQQIHEINGFQDCNRLEKCVMLDVPCLEVISHNSFLWFKWDVEGRLTNLEQKDYYVKNCMDAG